MIPTETATKISHPEQGEWREGGGGEAGGGGGAP